MGWCYVIISVIVSILFAIIGYLFGYLNGVSDTQAYNYMLKHGMDNSEDKKDV